MPGHVLLMALLLWTDTTGAAPAFPWASFRAIAQEQPAGDVGLCNPEDDHTKITAMFIGRPPGFYRMWAMLDGPEWLAVHYDGDARPDWVWRGTWAGDRLTVTWVSPFDPYAHASACHVLFGSDL